jgi:hypothetical protein
MADDQRPDDRARRGHDQHRDADDDQPDQPHVDRRGGQQGWIRLAEAGEARFDHGPGANDRVRDRDGQCRHRHHDPRDRSARANRRPEHRSNERGSRDSGRQERGLPKGERRERGWKRDGEPDEGPKPARGLTIGLRRRFRIDDCGSYRCSGHRRNIRATVC